MKRVIKVVSAIILMTVVICTGGCKKTDDPNNGGNNNGQNDSIVVNNGSANGHEYVDLGLPSGTLWATCNVGSDTPEGYGDLFAWGETWPKDDEYDWDNYKWYGGRDENGYVAAYVTKYCTNSIYGCNGFTDNLTTLQPTDDAASVNWGMGWRTPTREEWYELIAYTTSVYTTQNGVNGMLFTATNGNYVFLADSEGDYWSSSLDTHASVYAYCYCFDDSDEAGVSNEWRPNGKNIRAVRDNSSLVVYATAKPVAGGEVTGGGSYNAGSNCTLTATTFDGYTFLNWTENAEVVSTDAVYSFIVAEDRCLVANFVFTVGNCEYIDLGLPSGTLWATCNVGATAPEDYGDYFAWGETQPKEYYNWSNYQYCNGDFDQLTKYCTDASCGYNGFTDDLTTLLSEDDAATANWGIGWRIPTKEEWRELYDNTTNTWTTRNGVNGRLFTASNGNGLFLPAAGGRTNGDLNCVGSSGIYWSSSLDTDHPRSAWFFYFNSNKAFVNADSYRSDGFSVRPVRAN